MKKMYKAMLLVLCAVLLVAGSVMGTLAYLKAQTKAITNVMTVGKVNISLSESKVDEYGKITSGSIVATATEVTGGSNSYKLVPGHTYAKDPKVTVKANSEACYLFVKVVNGISTIEAGTTIAEQMDANGWTEMGSTDVWYKHINTVTATDTSHAVFTSFTIKGNAAVADYSTATITITAYAVQAEGFATAEAAWDAANFS